VRSIIAVAAQTSLETLPAMSPVCRLPVKAIPNAPTDKVVGWVGGSLKIKVHAPALDGRANDALCGFVAQALGVPRGAVALAQGARSRLKVLEIRGLTLAEVRARLAPPS
jgi:uncharacterized protein